MGSEARTRKKPGKKTQAKAVVKQPKVISKGARLRKKPQYKSFRLHERIVHPESLPPVGALSIRALKLLRANSGPIGWFTVVYGLLILVFVRGVVSPVDIDSVRAEFEQQTGAESSFTNNITILGLMVSSSFSVSGEVSALYQAIFIVTSVLALIWLFRQQQAGTKVSMKDAFYRGMYPLVPFVLVCVAIVLQTIPVLIGNSLYGSVIRGGLAVTFVEQFVWFLFFLSMILLSIYLIVPSLIGLFVVTLPDMTPRNALAQAKKLVEHRRFRVLLRIALLFFVMATIYVAVVFPAIFVSSTLAQLLFFFLTVLAVPFAVAYLFVLYRELL